MEMMMLCMLMRQVQNHWSRSLQPNRNLNINLSLCMGKNNPISTHGIVFKIGEF